jgi:hypothetical protein
LLLFCRPSVCTERHADAASQEARELTRGTDEQVQWSRVSARTTAASAPLPALRLPSRSFSFPRCLTPFFSPSRVR